MPVAREAQAASLTPSPSPMIWRWERQEFIIGTAYTNPLVSYFPSDFLCFSGKHSAREGACGHANDCARNKRVSELVHHPVLVLELVVVDEVTSPKRLTIQRDS